MSEAFLVKGNRPVDVEPISGSSNLITSGAVANALENVSSPPEVHIGKNKPTGEEVVWFNNEANEAVIMTRKIVNTDVSHELLEDTIIYVSNSGSDDIGNGSYDAPFATINKAVNSLPKNLNGFNATIKFTGENETFNEAVNLKGFYGGELIFSGNEATDGVSSCSISKVNITNCTLVRFLDLDFTTTEILQINSTVYVENSQITINDANTGIELKAASNFITDEKSTITVGTCITAINTMELSRMYIYNITGGSYNIIDGIIAESGSTVNITKTSLIASTLYTTSSGGAISINAQPTVSNY